MSASVGAAKFTPAFLEELRQVGDPEADAAVATYLDDELHTSSAIDMMKLMIAAAAGQRRGVTGRSVRSSPPARRCLRGPNPS